MQPEKAITEITARLRTMRPDATTDLNWNTPFDLLIATILAAQCTDERINALTPGLFERYPTPRAFADAELAELEEAVRPSGFFRNKAKAVKGACAKIVEEHGGDVPNTMKELTALPGVARKTANVVLGTALGINAGVVVDTHVSRVSQRLALVPQGGNAKAIEDALMKLVRQSDWTWFAHAMTLHGRYECKAKKPQCERCQLADVCPQIGL